MRYLGVDLAWGEKKRTGLAALGSDGALLSSTAVRTDDEIAAFVEEHASGPVVTAIDAPLVVPNETGQRDCERLLNAEFGRYRAGAHPSNRSRAWFVPEPRGARLARRFGWEIDPSVRPDGERSVAIEVYPHPAMVSLFDLPTVIPYKNKRGRTVASRRVAFVELLDAVDRVCGPVLRLSDSARWADIRATVRAAERPVDLDAIEDEIDAIFCAYLAWLWGTSDPRMRVLGDLERGYIVVPGPPSVPPGPPAAVLGSPSAPSEVVDDTWQLVATVRVSGAPATFATAGEAAWKREVHESFRTWAARRGTWRPEAWRYMVEVDFRTRPPRRAGEAWDIDNLVKPTLDAMGPVLGERAWRGPVQAADDRVDRLVASKAPAQADPGADIRVYVRPAPVPPD